MTSHTAAVAWLERDYDQPGRFRVPVHLEVHTPRDLFEAMPDHRSDCFCETGEGEIWTQAGAAAKWRAA
jgi:hypothetical protein